MSLGSVVILRLFRSSSSGGRCAQLRRFSSASFGGHTPEGHFSAKLRHLLTRRRGKDAVENGGARESFVNAIGLSKPEDRDRVSPETIASSLCNHYRSVAESEEQKIGFLSVLAKDLGVDQEAVLAEAKHLCDLHSHHRTEAFTLLHSESNLRSTLTPFYLELFNVVARMEGGIKFLVDLRGDLLSTIKSLKKKDTQVHLLEELNTHLKTVLGQWFSPQLMELYKVTWQSPCDILEKISHYEAVHPLRHWKDLKHRVGKNRRCFIFQHKAIPREPIVVLHCALTSKPSSRIHTLLDRTLEEKPEDINTAVFYSVFSTQKGLSGVELGNYLIKMVAKELLKEFPQQLKNLVTLSPIPGFRRWLDSHLKQHSEQEEGCLISEEELKPVADLFPTSGGSDHLLMLREVLKSREWIVDCESSLRHALELPLTSLCARYLSVVKRRGQAMDPVAHFHLQNGASIWRVNWMANTSPQGLQNSYGMMVNYRYNLDDINRNSVTYRMSGSTALSQSVKELL